MSNAEYECAVNKTHPRKTFSTVQKPPPMCCGRIMTQTVTTQQPAYPEQLASAAQPKTPAVATTAKQSWWKGLFGKIN